MANDLTGDFDVVAEFTIDTANRVLAAMHSGNRFPHSWSLRVDDVFHSKRTIRSIVDTLGEAITDPVLVNAVALAPSALRGHSASDPIYQSADPLVNVGDAHVPGPADPGHLRGVAQLQFGPPTVTVPDDSGASLVTHTPVMARYFPDPGTMEVPEYLRGVIEITFGAQEVFSQAGPFIFVSLVGLGGNVQFIPSWSSAPLHPPQLAAINKAFRNSLVNSFQPSSTPLPTGILNLQFKTMPPDSPALAVLMNLPGGTYATGQALGEGLFGLPPGSPDPADLTEVFLQDGDDFALAVSSDYFTAPFTSAVDKVIDDYGLRQKQLVDRTWELKDFTGHVWGSATLSADVSVGNAIVELQGQVLLKIPVRLHVNVHFVSHTFLISAPDDFDKSFDIVISEAFDLSLDGGEVVGLNPLSDKPAVQIPSDVPSNVTDAVRSQAQSIFSTAWGSVRDQVNQQVKHMLSTDNLREFLDPLTNPPHTPGTEPVKHVSLQLAYTSYDIKSTGVILHGTLQVPAWPPARVEFDSRRYSFSSPHGIYSGTEYSALKTWIPGGTIQEFIWNLSDGPQLRDDWNTFVLPDAEVGLRHLCLTVKGTRVSATDPFTPEAVTRTFCAWSIRFSAAAGGLVQGGSQGRPDIALTQFSASGALEILGHTSLWASERSPAGGIANLIVHFPDNHTVAGLDFLTRALKESGRADTAAGIVVVLTPDQLTRLKPVDGIMFADDDPAWSHLLGVERRPATFVIGTSGNVVWHYQGELTSADLAAALKKYLVAGGVLRPRLLQSDVRIGQPTPNFLFESAPGCQLTLRKLAGRRVVLVFWKSTSPPSLETLRDLQKVFASAGSQGPVVLAINDGEPFDVAKRVAAENGLSAIVVPDPKQGISSAYGVNIWPTAIFLDEGGLVSNIRYGRFSAELAKYPSQEKRPPGSGQGT